MNHLLHILLTHLEQGRHAVQATILTHEGSTPRSAGSRMLLAAGSDDNSDGGPGEGPHGPLRILAGTVGGGLVEAQVMARAADVLSRGERSVETFELTGELAAGADMICGGRLRVFLERLDPADLPLFQRLDQGLRQGQRCLRLTPLDAGPSALLLADGIAEGGTVSPELAEAARRAGQEIAAPVVIQAEGHGYALEPFAAASPLFIFGAGHVSRPTAQVAALCGFSVTVLDDRPDFANARRFPQAQVCVLASFQDCFSALPASATGPEAFVVIVTRGHVHDADVLAQALRTNAGYVGMIGSRRKRDAVYARLRSQGFTEADLSRVRCPIGLSIEAETPEEIAVSIVGELIACRAQTRAAGMPL